MSSLVECRPGLARRLTPLLFFVLFLGAGVLACIFYPTAFGDNGAYRDTPFLHDRIRQLIILGGAMGALSPLLLADLLLQLNQYARIRGGYLEYRLRLPGRGGVYGILPRRGSVRLEDIQSIDEFLWSPPVSAGSSRIVRFLAPRLFTHRRIRILAKDHPPVEIGRMLDQKRMANLLRQYTVGN